MNTNSNIVPASQSIVEPIVIPGTGEIVDLANAPTTSLAGYLDAFRRLDIESRRAKGHITDELATRLDHEGRASFTTDEWKISVTAPDAVKYDPDRVYAVLKLAVTAGVISEDAAELACPEVTSRKVSKRDLDRIKKVLPQELLDELTHAAEPQARRVTLSRTTS